MRILLVEDEKPLGAVIKRGLEARNHAVDWETHGAVGLETARRNEYDLIILDVMLPGKDGWEICTAIRAGKNRTPILMLTARGDVDDRVRGLELGADDYLPKPFEFKELRARVAALLRRGQVNKGFVIEIGDLVIDTQKRLVERGGIEIVLTPREYALLEALARYEGEVLSREMIQERVWSDAGSYSNTVEVHVSALRRKIDSDSPVRLIHTVSRVGYTIRAPSREVKE